MGLLSCALSIKDLLFLGDTVSSPAIYFILLISAYFGLTNAVLKLLFIKNRFRDLGNIGTMFVGNSLFIGAIFSIRILVIIWGRSLMDNQVICGLRI